MRHCERVFEHLERCSEINTLWENLAEVNVRERNYEEAALAYRRLLASLEEERASEEASAFVRFRLGMVLYLDNRLWEAEKEMFGAYGIYRRLHEEKPDEYPDEAAICALKLGIIKCEMYDCEEALRLIREAASVIGDSVHLTRFFGDAVNLGIAENLVKLGLYDESDSFLDKYIHAEELREEDDALFPDESHYLSVIFDHLWEEEAESDEGDPDSVEEDPDPENQSWKRGLTEREIRSGLVNRIKTGLKAVINLTEAVKQEPDDFSRWTALIRQEQLIAGYYMELGDHKASFHYKNAIRLTDAVDMELEEEDYETQSELDLMRGEILTAFADQRASFGKSDEEIRLLRLAADAYRRAYGNMYAFHYGTVEED